jgi:hypothetical protein
VCERLNDGVVTQASACEFHSTGALDLAYYECRRSETSTWLVFHTEDACQEALETTHANAP